MKKPQSYTVAVLVVVAIVGYGLVAQGQADPSQGGEGDRRAQAERCVKAAPTDVVARLACRRVATVRTDIPESRRQEFAKAMLSELDLDLMRAKRVEVMAKQFSTAELKALADFYESPAGHSAWQKLDDYVVAMHAEMKDKMLDAEARARKAVGLPAKP